MSRVFIYIHTRVTQSSVVSKPRSVFCYCYQSSSASAELEGNHQNWQDQKTKQNTHTEQNKKHNKHLLVLCYKEVSLPLRQCHQFSRLLLLRMRSVKTSIDSSLAKYTTLLPLTPQGLKIVSHSCWRRTRNVSQSVKKKNRQNKEETTRKRDTRTR